jgi:HK97 family phage major capsid protein
MEWEAKLKELTTEQAKLWEGYKTEVGTELKKFQDRLDGISPESKEKIDKMEKDFGKLETQITEARENLEKEQKTKADADEKRFKEMEAKLNRPRSSSTPEFEAKDFISKGLYEQAIAEGADKKADATWKALRSPGVLTPEEKVLSLNDPETGGYLAPPDYINSIIKELREITPALQIAAVRNTSANNMVFPKKTGTIAAKRRGEQEAKSESTGLTYGTEQITLPEMYAYMDVTEMDLEDTMFSLDAEIREEITDAFNAKLGTEFVEGEGPLQLEGLLVNGDIGEVAGGATSALDADGLIDFIVAGLQAQYQPGASLMMKLATVSAIRQLQDGAGAYIWAPGFGTTPNSIMGKPYWVSEDMPTIAADAYPILYGNFKRGYQIGMRIRMALKRITDSTLDAAGTVRFSARMRVGGKVVLAPAIKKLKVATSV